MKKVKVFFKKCVSNVTIKVTRQKKKNNGLNGKALIQERQIWIIKGQLLIQNLQESLKVLEIRYVVGEK